MGIIKNGLYYVDPELQRARLQGLQATGIEREYKFRENMKAKDQFLAHIRTKVKQEMREEAAARGQFSI